MEYTQHQLSDVYQYTDEQVYCNTDPVRHPVLLNVALYDMGLFAKDGLHGCAHDVLFKDIFVLTDAPLEMPPSIFTGLDAQHSVQNVRVEGLYFNGERITDPQKANFVIGGHAKEIQLI